MRGGFGCNENPIISSTFAAAGFETKSCDVQERLLFDNDGMPAPFVERRALDASGVEIPHDGQAIGELVYRSPITIDGYYHNDAATSRAFRDGWYFSGNMVTVAPDGRVNITERIDDMVVTPSRYVSPRKIEEALKMNPVINLAAVIGKRDGDFEVPIAIIELKEGVRLTVGEVLESCHELLPQDWWPAFVEFVEKISETATSKFDKVALKKPDGG